MYALQWDLSFASIYLSLFTILPKFMTEVLNFFNSPFACDWCLQPLEVCACNNTFNAPIGSTVVEIPKK